MTESSFDERRIFMTLNQLKYFCETCRCHSITAAANQLFVTQPAISLAIRELEAEFGITLLHDSTTGSP